MPKQPHSLAELQVDLPHAADVKLHNQHQHDPHRKQIAFAEHQPHKRVKQRRQSRRDVAVKQEHEKIELFIDFIDVFAVFRRAQIADASGKRGIHLVEQIIQAFQHKPIVGIYAHAGQPDKRGHNQVVRAADDDRTESVHAHRHDVFENVFPFFLVRQTLFIPEIGIIPVHLESDDGVGHHQRANLHRQIQQKIARQRKHHDLQNHLRRAQQLLDHRLDIGFLIGQQNRIFIRQQIGADRIAQIHQIDDPQILDTGIALDEHIQKRQQRKPDEQHKCRDNPVQHAVQVHQPAQLFAVILRCGLVHAENHRRPDTQFREVQHAENVGKQPVDAQIRRRQIADKDHPADKRQHHVQQMAAHTRHNIDEGIFCPHRAFSSRMVSPFAFGRAPRVLHGG